MDIRDGTSNVLFAVVTSPEHAVTWTRPEDLAIDEQGTFADKLEWCDNQTTVLTCDGDVSSIDSSIPPTEWHHRACRSDGH